MQQEFAAIRNLRILFVCHDSKLFGAPRSLFNLIEGINRYHPEIDVHVILPSEGLLTDEFKRVGINYTVVFFPWTVTRFKAGSSSYEKFKGRLVKLKKTVRQLPNFIKAVNEIKPNVIYSNTSAITTGFFAAKFLKIKHIWHIREFGWEDHRQTYDWTYPIQRMFYNHSSLLISISKAIKVSKLSGLKVPVKQIYNGVYFSDDLTWPIRVKPKERYAFGIVGGIREAKGQTEAIEGFAEAYKRNKTLTLLIVGHTDIHAVNSLQELAKSLSCLDGIEFIPFEKDVDRIYSRIDVLLNCSRSEGMGRTLVEAMAHGIPVISKNTGGAVEIVVEGSNGLLYSDVKDLTLKMEEIIESDSYSAFSENAISWVKSNFTIEKYTESVVTAIKSISV